MKLKYTTARPMEVGEMKLKLLGDVTPPRLLFTSPAYSVCECDE